MHRYGNTKKAKSGSATTGDMNTALAAVALQDHWIRNLDFTDPLKPKKRPSLQQRLKPVKKEVTSVVDTGRKKPPVRPQPKNLEQEYVLDPKPPPATLAQKLGLVDAPRGLLSEAEWGDAKSMANTREDFVQPCVICKDELGTQEQVLLSCSHVFHRACLQAFERFTGRKSCPMCRKEQYQTRVVHDGSRAYRNKCATKIQAAWRGYVVFSWCRKLRETNPPKDPRLRQKFYEEKLHTITDRMVKSLDMNVNSFLRDIDQSLEASRDVFRQFDGVLRTISDSEWDNIQLKAVERGDKDCPICLTALVSEGLDMKPSKKKPNPSPDQSKCNANSLPAKSNLKSKTLPTAKKPLPSKQSSSGNPSVENKKVKPSVPKKSTILLSCSHVFHKTCLEALEDFAVEERKFLCPVCRSAYQKKVL